MEDFLLFDVRLYRWQLAFVYIVCALTLKGVDQKPLAVPKVKPGEYTCVPRGFLLRPFCPGIVKISRAMTFNYRACVKKKGRMGATTVAKGLTRNVMVGAMLLMVRAGACQYFDNI